MNDVYDRLRATGCVDINGKGESATARRLVRQGLAEYGRGVMQIVVCPGVNLPDVDPGAPRVKASVTDLPTPIPPRAEDLEMIDESRPVRLRNFHAACGARIFTGWAEGEHTPRYYASDAVNAAALEDCPTCGLPLFVREPIEFNPGSNDTAQMHYRIKTAVLTAFEMERRYLAARERLCAGAPLDAEAVVCMSAELEEGLTLDELAPLYGRDPETLRAELSAFTPANHEPAQTS